ncbi:NlpC/P60 family protein [Pseudomonas sp.]|uniref:NlpC/P60 family protein n=1 Tax=Pseudomonas sp. TaxID=306 RepID=UPI003F371636
MTHWAFAYIGQPWVSESHDCWGFFRRVQRERFGREIPPFDVDAFNRLACARAVAGNPERANWRPVAVPAEGDAVLLAHARHPSHVGLWVAVDGGGVLHCVNGPGVVFQSVKMLKASGWGHLEFYRHV